MANVDTLENRIQQIDGWIHALNGEVHFLDERVHLLKPLVLDSEVQAAIKAKLDKTMGVALWNHLAPLLGQDYIRDLARLFLDKGKDTGSLTNLWRKLQGPGMREHYRDSYGRMFDHLHDGSLNEIRERDWEASRQRERDMNMAIFDEKWAAISVALASLAGDAVAICIMTFRDKRHAHWEMQKLGEEPKPFDINRLGLTFNGVFAFGQRCEKILAELSGLLTQADWEPSEFTDISAEQGRALWLTLAT